MSEEQNLPDVEQINGKTVGFSYLRFYRKYPEIGLPLSDQSGDVGGYQDFENAALTWTGTQIRVSWRDGIEAPLGWKAIVSEILKFS